MKHITGDKLYKMEGRNMVSEVTSTDPNFKVAPPVNKAPEEIRRDERRRVWEEINKHIKKDLSDCNGWYEQAERNGLILATNIIFDLGI